VVLKDGRPEFRADAEQEAIEYRDRWMRNGEVEAVKVSLGLDNKGAFTP
jgi:hypothetical protein